MGDLFALPESAELGFISAMVAGVIGSLYDVDTAIGNAAFGGITDIWNSLSGVFTWLEGVFAALWNVVQQVLHWLLHTLLPDLIKWVNEIRTKITAWLQ